MDIPMKLDTHGKSSKKALDANKLEKTKQKAADAWKQIKAEKKTVKIIPAVITKNPQGVRHRTKDFVVRPKKKPQAKGKVIVMRAKIDDDITVTKKIYVSKKKVSHPKLQKLLRGKHGK